MNYLLLFLFLYFVLSFIFFLPFSSYPSISFCFRWFGFISFPFRWFRFVSFRFRWFHFVSFLFRFALYRYPYFCRTFEIDIRENRRDNQWWTFQRPVQSQAEDSQQRQSKAKEKHNTGNSIDGEYGPTKRRRWRQVLAMGKQFLFLIGHPRCYS